MSNAIADVLGSDVDFDLDSDISSIGEKNKQPQNKEKFKEKDKVNQQPLYQKQILSQQQEFEEDDFFQIDQVQTKTQIQQKKQEILDISQSSESQKNYQPQVKQQSDQKNQNNNQIKKIEMKLSSVASVQQEKKQVNQPEVVRKNQMSYILTSEASEVNQQTEEDIQENEQQMAESLIQQLTSGRVNYQENQVVQELGVNRSVQQSMNESADWKKYKDELDEEIQTMDNNLLKIQEKVQMLREQSEIMHTQDQEEIENFQSTAQFQQFQSQNDSQLNHITHQSQKQNETNSRQSNKNQFSIEESLEQRKVQKIIQKEYSENELSSEVQSQHSDQEINIYEQIPNNTKFKNTQDILDLSDEQLISEENRKQQEIDSEEESLKHFNTYQESKRQKVKVEIKGSQSKALNQKEIFQKPQKNITQYKENFQEQNEEEIPASQIPIAIEAPKKYRLNEKNLQMLNTNSGKEEMPKVQGKNQRIINSKQNQQSQKEQIEDQEQQINQLKIQNIKYEKQISLLKEKTKQLEQNLRKQEDSSQSQDLISSLQQQTQAQKEIISKLILDNQNLKQQLQLVNIQSQIQPSLIQKQQQIYQYESILQNQQIRAIAKPPVNQKMQINQNYTVQDQQIKKVNEIPKFLAQKQPSPMKAYMNAVSKRQQHVVKSQSNSQLRRQSPYDQEKCFDDYSIHNPKVQEQEVIYQSDKKPKRLYVSSSFLGKKQPQKVEKVPWPNIKSYRNVK